VSTTRTDLMAGHAIETLRGRAALVTGARAASELRSAGAWRPAVPASRLATGVTRKPARTAGHPGQQRVSSVIGETGNIGPANYAASKSGLFGLTKSLAKEAVFQLSRAQRPVGDGIGLTVSGGPDM